MKTHRIRNLLSVLVSTALFAAAGCAPTTFEKGMAFYANQYRVRDAAARRAGEYWYLRFNELTLSDLEDAIAAGRRGENSEMRRLGVQAIRAAHSYGETVAAKELDRLPADGRAKLAQLTDTDAASAVLYDEYSRRADSALETQLARLMELPDRQFLAELRDIRSRVEPLPDDRDRLQRQILLGWAALPAWMGVSSVEAKLDEHRRSTSEPGFKKGIVWDIASRGDEPLLCYAPVIVMESPTTRDYPEDSDRFGEVYLSGDPAHIDVHINTSRPVVYTYQSEAKINGHRYPQLVYVWWYPQRPAMEARDPAAGRIDGDTLRITLDAHNRPAIIEIVQGCGCGHLVYVSQQVEDKARRQYGDPLPGKQLAVERDVQGKRDLIVSGTLTFGEEDVRPVLYTVAGYHAVSEVSCGRAGQTLQVSIVAQHSYEMEDYDRLEQLPLGKGYGSMFGVDGLVHNAGRAEGYLLAPTGILSAGQPRKRGTQKIRWDEYSFEDPRLLEHTLRLPDEL